MSALLACACLLVALVSGEPAPMVAMPPSTLVAPGVTSLPLALATTAATSCKWDSANVPYASMKNAFAGAGGTSHSTTLSGLSGGLASSVYYVQCAAFAGVGDGAPLVLAYRSLPDSGSAPFPRLGNLWGSGNFRGHPEGLKYAASRSSLWLGSDWSASEIQTLRSYNPYTIALTSINACETNDQDLPDAFYLTNITQPSSTKGRLQSWPGTWRLDLTNPDVQSYQVHLMYCLVVYGGSGYGSRPGCINATIPPMTFDGLFVDNVFMDNGAAVNSQDIYHNPFIPMDRATGKPMVNFNERWKLGMIAMIAQFREMMPSAVLDGHAMDVSDGNITAQFNAISIGFTTPEIIEGRMPFATGLANYNEWMTLTVHTPRLTMIESAVRFQLGYGYGFNTDLATLINRDCENSNSVPGAPMPGNGAACYPSAPQPPGYIPPETFMFARSEYQYMRFGLGFTLMGDGYFTHELGDSWHGMDWDYDELHFNFGAALGNATAANVLNPNPPPVPPPIPLTRDWILYVRTPDGSNASWAFDAAVVPYAGAPPSVRVDVEGSAPSSDGIDLSQVVAFENGGYRLTFWARATIADTPVQLNSRKNGGDWHSFGLDAPIVVGAQWQLFNVSFTSATGLPGGDEGRLSWFIGAAASYSSVWVNQPLLVGVPRPLPVLTRDFECGAVIHNGDTANRTVLLGAGLARLIGQQAPRWQYFVDDASNAFTALTGQWAVDDYDNGYHGNTTWWQEEVRPANGFYHHWEIGASRAPAPASATFDLRIPVAGEYNVSMWWPAAVPAREGWANAMSVSIKGGGAITASVDLRTQGGDVFFLVAANAQLDPSATLTIDCAGGGGDCIADAVLVESAARYNDGSAAPSVTLQPMDAIMLRRTTGAPAHCQ